MLSVTLDDGTLLVIPDEELTFAATRGSGPGGQHVNVTASRVTVRFNVVLSAALSEQQKNRIMSRLSTRISSEGIISVSSSDGRSQHSNKAIALERLGKLLKVALHVPKKRTKTRVTLAQKQKRLDNKKRRSAIKRIRNKAAQDY